MTVPALFRGLLDDAALFPPGNAPMGQAVPAHRAHRAAWYADAVGPFLCGGSRIGELKAQVETRGETRPNAGGSGPLPVVLVLPGGSAQLAPALEAAAGLELAGVEIAAGDDLAGTLAALERHLPPDVPAAVELPRGRGLQDALDRLAGSPYRAKLRTGGVVSDAFPSVEELAAFLAGCAERAVPYKCTAGLHNAVRHTDPRTGFEHHGFLNVLLAAMSGDAAVAAAVLAEQSGKVLADAASELTPNQITFIRSSFTAFGTCSVAEPLADLTELGLIVPPVTLEDR